MIVLDASAAVLGLLNDGDARRMVASEHVVIPHIADAEIAHAVRGQVRRRAIGPDHGRLVLQRWARLGLDRIPIVGLLDRMWALRDNLTAYDAAYVALAERLDCRLVTADARLAAAPGPTCAVTVVRS